jgi:hypothetical protein
VRRSGAQLRECPRHSGRIPTAARPPADGGACGGSATATPRPRLSTRRRKPLAQTSPRPAAPTVRPSAGDGDARVEPRPAVADPAAARPTAIPIATLWLQPNRPHAGRGLPTTAPPASAPRHRTATSISRVEPDRCAPSGLLLNLREANERRGLPAGAERCRSEFPTDDRTRVTCASEHDLRLTSGSPASHSSCEIQASTARHLSPRADS